MEIHRKIDVIFLGIVSRVLYEEFFILYINIIVIREILGHKKTKLHNIIHSSAVKVVLFLSLNFTVVVKSLLFSTMVF